MMKILFITSLYPAYKGHSVQEISYALHDIVKHWVKIHNVVVVRPYFVPQKKRIHYERNFVLDDVTVYNLPVLRVPKVGTYVSFSSVEKTLRRLGFNPDFVIAELSSSFLWAYKLAEHLDSKFVIGIHQSDLKVVHRNRYVKALERSYKIVCRSESVRRRFLELFPEYANKVFLGNLGIPKRFIETKASFEEKAEMWKEKRKIHFLTAAVFQKLKNIDINLIALSNLKKYDWDYTIIGDGEERKNLEDLVEKLELQDRVIFLGMRNREEVLERMKDSDVYVMVSAPETFGLAYLEAMSKANIVVASKGWGVDGIVKNGENGFLVSPRNVSELTYTLQTLLELKYDEAAKIIDKTWETINNYTEENISMEYLKNVLEIELS